MGECNLPFSQIEYFNQINLSSPLALGGGIDICAHGLFCTKFHSELSFEAFLDVMRIFGSFES